MNLLSLFAGIGGLELGLERAGMQVVGQVELDDWCRSILAKHWPDAARHDDVRTAPAWWSSTARPQVDVVCGGFPCQPFSIAGSRKGIADERWGWPWFADVVRLVRPRWVVVENVAALLADGDAFGCLLTDLAALGFDVEWDCLPAGAVGAPHRRDRLFVVAYAASEGLEGRQGPAASRAPRRVFPGRGGATRVAWPPEPEPNGVGYGLPDWVDRIRALGNAVVPQVAELIGDGIMAAEAESAAA